MLAQRPDSLERWGRERGGGALRACDTGVRAFVGHHARAGLICNWPSTRRWQVRVAGDGRRRALHKEGEKK